MWRYVGASVAGTSHLTRNILCQDAHVVASQPYGVDNMFWAVVADGAGSASRSDIGARTVCDGLSRRISRWLSVHQNSGVPLDSVTVSRWLETMRRRLAGIADEEELPLREFACTVAGIVVAHDAAICFQVGDSSIVVGDNQGDYEVVFWPDNGEYVNTTHFITDDTFPARLLIRQLSTVPSNVALFTDGLQRLALHLASQTVHAPFFTPMFRRLTQETSGLSVVLHSGLRDFLNSAAINQRTDDDKTLVLATRLTS